MKAVYIVNSSYFFCSHFLELAKETQQRGYLVTVIAGDEEKKDLLKELNFDFICIPLTRKGINPLRELKTFFILDRIIRKIKPDIVHSFTVKPVIYAGLSNFIKRNTTTYIASVTGMGSAFLSQKIKHKMLWFLLQYFYKVVFSSSNTKVIFENKDDSSFFIEHNIAPAKRVFLVNGAGVDIGLFTPNGKKDKPFKVTMVCRLLKDKGVREYISAGKVLKGKGLSIQLQLVGSIDEGNISSLSAEELNDAISKKYIEYLGQRSDVASIYQQSHVACLPSYREGLPKSLIEAISCGLPIITTDVPGCRQMIFDNKNGILVEVKSSTALADAIESLYSEPQKLLSMGNVSREMAVMYFGTQQVIDSFHKIYNV